MVHTVHRQIAAGGPVTVTHPEMRRYFMTIPEAVQLLLQASVLGQGGEVFLLDMGEPVKIVDLARDMIELSGLEVSTDIEIVFAGMRSGEKLFEEPFVKGESHNRTRHEKIYPGGCGAAGRRQGGAAATAGCERLSPGALLACGLRCARSSRDSRIVCGPRVPGVSVAHGACRREACGSKQHSIQDVSQAVHFHCDPASQW